MSKRTLEQMDDSDESSSLSDSEENMEIDEEEIEVDFEVYYPKPEDFPSVKVLFTNFFVVATPETAVELATWFCNESEAGSVIKTTANDDVTGLITALNFHTGVDEVKGLQQIQEYILQNSKEKKEIFENLFQDKTKPLGLILNVKMPNLPSQLSQQLNTALFEEITWVVNQHEDEQIRKDYKFENFLLVTSYHETPEENTQQKNKKTKANTSIQPKTYMNAEDEAFEQFSEFTITFPYINATGLTSRWTLSGNKSQYVCIMLVKSDKIPQILQKIAEIC